MIQNLPIFTESMPLAEVLSTPVGSWWIRRLKSVGIPPKHTPAHLQRNCSIFATMNGKDEAYKVGLLYSKKGFTMRDNRMRHSIMFCGGVGTGKTWIGTAVFKHIMYNMDVRNAPKQTISAIWTTFSGIIRAVQGTYSSKEASTEYVIQKFQRSRLLYIDDFGDMESGTSDDKRSITFDIMDHRNSHSLPTIITTNLEMGEMKSKWGARLFDRIAEMSSIIPMSGENMRSKDVGKITDIEDLERLSGMTKKDDLSAQNRETFSSELPF